MTGRKKNTISDKTIRELEDNDIMVNFKEMWFFFFLSLGLTSSPNCLF